MARRCNLLFTTAMLAGLCMSGIEPASAQKSPSISPPNISPMRPDFNTRAPNILRDRDVSNPSEVEVPNKKAKPRRTVREEDYRERAEPLPRVQRAKASKLGKKTKIPLASVTNVVSDRVLKTGSKISGGWREYAADLSWRRVVFTLDGPVATIVFSDGMPGGLLPAVTHFARSGPGPKGSPATYDEIRIFPGTTPVILDKAKQSSSFPSGVATRIRQLGGDIQVMQQLADIKRIAELGSALDAVRAAHDAGGFLPDLPRESPGEGNWSDPRSGVGRDGRASDEPSPDKVEITDDTRDAEGYGSYTTVTDHADDSSSETTTTWRDRDGSQGHMTTIRDKRGRETSGGGAGRDSNGDRWVMGYTRNPRTGVIRGERSTLRPDGTTVIMEVHTPPETGGSSGGFDEAWLYRALPWMMDASYEQWKRESDLVQSGGRIAQPGRGEQSTLILNEGPEVGAEGVVNCGAETNPCARPAGVAVDPRGGFRSISQPGRGVGPDAPAETGPRPPIPQPQ